MTKLTVESQTRHGAAKALEPHVQDFAARPGHTIVGIAELRRTKITTVDDGTDQDAVKVALLTFEPAPAETGHQLRSAAAALRALRTAEGTLTADMDAEVAEQTMKHLAGMLGFEEAVRLKIGVAPWLGMLSSAVDRPRSEITVDDLLDDAKLVVMGLSAVLDGVTEPTKRAHDDDRQGDLFTDRGERVDEGTGEIEGTARGTAENPGHPFLAPEDADESGYDGPTSPDLPPGHPGYRPEGWTDPGSASYGSGSPDRDDLHEASEDEAP
jgi:hypothetical protein